MKISSYPVIEMRDIPDNIYEMIRQYCIESDLHPSNRTYIDYNVSDMMDYINNSELFKWLYSIGIRDDHVKVLIHFDY